MTQKIKTEKCSKHGVVHKNGGYPSCPKNIKEVDTLQGDSWDLETFMDFCDLYRDYFKKAEIEMSDTTIGHLACIGRDYVKSQILQEKARVVDSVEKEIQVRIMNEDNPQYVLGWNACRYLILDLLR